MHDCLEHIVKINMSQESKGPVKTETDRKEADKKDITGESRQSPARPTRGRSYQETRRYDRDRRNNWRQAGAREDKAKSEEGEVKGSAITRDTSWEKKTHGASKDDSHSRPLDDLVSKPPSRSKSDSAQPVQRHNSGKSERFVKSDRSEKSSSYSCQSREDKGRRGVSDKRTSDWSKSGSSYRAHGDGPPQRNRDR